MTATLSLNALRVFYAVACSGSMTVAATELGVTPSAVSRQIRNLEENIGMALLVRNGRGMRLTADGRKLESGLADAFAQIDGAVERLRRPTRGELLRVTVPPIFAAAWLVPRLERFNALRPETEVILLDRDEPVGALGDSELVVSWGLFEDDATAVAERLNHSEEVFPVCRPQARGSGGLAEATLLHYETVGSAWNWPTWPEFLDAAGIETERCRAGPRLTPALLYDAVMRGKGVMLANWAITQDDLGTGRLVRPVPESMQVDECYWLLTAKAARSRPEVQAFCSWLKKEFDIFSKQGNGLGR